MRIMRDDETMYASAAADTYMPPLPVRLRAGRCGGRRFRGRRCGGRRLGRVGGGRRLGRVDGVGRVGLVSRLHLRQQLGLRDLPLLDAAQQRGRRGGTLARDVPPRHWRHATAQLRLRPRHHRATDGEEVPARVTCRMATKRRAASQTASTACAQGCSHTRRQWSQCGWYPERTPSCSSVCVLYTAVGSVSSTPIPRDAATLVWSPWADRGDLVRQQGQADGAVHRRVVPRHEADEGAARRRHLPFRG